MTLTREYRIARQVLVFTTAGGHCRETSASGCFKDGKGSWLRYRNRNGHRGVPSRLILHDHELVVKGSIADTAPMPPHIPDWLRP